MSSKQEQIQELSNQIMKHRRLYYKGEPEISDQAYDQLEKSLEQLEPSHPLLAQVGDELIDEESRVEHERPMLSLAKTYKLDELESWMKDKPVVGMWKVDGNSLSLIYEKGELKLAKTRGNGRFGENVTSKIRWVSAIPLQLDSQFDCEIRGELYCSEHRFAELVEEMLELGLERPNNPRNIVAGLLNRKAHLELLRFFDFFGFDVLSEVRFSSEEDKFKWLSDKGFDLPQPQLLSSSNELESYLEQVKNKMAEGSIGIDGAVFSYNDISLHESLGSTSHHPRFKMSFKWQGETALSKITKISWATSRLGIVTPVAVIEPIELSGAKITNITLHNAEHVKAYNLKKGDVIEIVRSGEVIPKFLRVIEAATGSYSWPLTCSSCDSELSFDGVRLRCENTNTCPAQISGSILNWIRNAEIDDLSEKRLDLLIAAGYVKEPSDLYLLDKDKLLSLPLIKDKMADKLLKNIELSKEIELASFLSGLGIGGAGRTSWERILSEYPDLDAILKLDVESIIAIDGFAEKSAQQIVEGIQEKSSMITRLLEVGVRPKSFERKRLAEQGNLSGMAFVITGSLSRPRQEIEALLVASGASILSGVSKKTTAVITNDPTSSSSKLKKASSLNIPIWSEEKLFSLMES